jgi:hypothetical protein
MLGALYETAVTRRCANSSRLRDAVRQAKPEVSNYGIEISTARAPVGDALGIGGGTDLDAGAAP